MENEARRGDWMQTYTGRQFWPLDPRPAEVCIEDIAHSLSLQCRFAGHCRDFYSVAEHCVRVSLALQEWEPGNTPLHLMGLLHDASEAYLVDLPRPVKPHLRGYSQAEDANMVAICERYGLQWENNIEWITVKRADNTLLATEARDLMGPHPAPWVAMPDPLEAVIDPWSPRRAEIEFLRRFDALGGQR